MMTYSVLSTLYVYGDYLSSNALNTCSPYFHPLKETTEKTSTLHFVFIFFFLAEANLFPARHIT